MSLNALEAHVTNYLIQRGYKVERGNEAHGIFFLPPQEMCKEFINLPPMTGISMQYALFLESELATKHKIGVTK